MLSKVIIGVLILILVGVGAWFISYYPAIVPQKQTTPTQAQTTTDQEAAPTQLTGEAAIKAYAAQQFKTTPDKLVVVSSTKKQWQDTCLGIALDPKACEKTPTAGYEMTFNIQGTTITYRGSDDGTIIRIVKQ